MGILVGGIDIAKQSLESEFLIKVIDKILDYMFAKNPSLKPSEAEIDKMKEQAIKELQAKYPEAGIVLNK